MTTSKPMPVVARATWDDLLDGVTARLLAQRLAAEAAARRVAA